MDKNKMMNIIPYILIVLIVIALLMLFGAFNKKEETISWCGKCK